MGRDIEPVHIHGVEVITRAWAVGAVQQLLPERSGDIDVIRNPLVVIREIVHRVATLSRLCRVEVIGGMAAVRRDHAGRGDGVDVACNLLVFGAEVRYHIVAPVDGRRIEVVRGAGVAPAAER